MDQRSKRKTIKLFEENIGQKLRVIGLGNDFLDMTPKAQVTNEKKQGKIFVPFVNDFLDMIPKSRRNHMNKSLEERKNMQIGEQ